MPESMRFMVSPRAGGTGGCVMGLTFGSLFAGVGGFDLGLERAGMRCIWQVENHPARQQLLSLRWPDVRRHDDVSTFPPEGDWRVDLICGGFPCQDISYCGLGAGINGKRSGLWSEYIRIVRDLRPRYVIVENVPALLARGWIEFSETWPRAGLMRNGIVFPRRPLVPLVRETGFLLWPTPRASMGDHMICWKRAENGEHHCNLEDFMAWLWLQQPHNKRERGLDVNPDWIDWFGGFPVRWTDLKVLETASSPQWQSGSEDES